MLGPTAGRAVHALGRLNVACRVRPGPPDERPRGPVLNEAILIKDAHDAF